MGVNLRSPGNWALAALFLAAGIYVVERLVVTDHEAIVAEVEAATEACERGDFETLRDALTEDFQQGNGRDRDATIKDVRSAFGRFTPVGLRADVGEITIEDGEAKTTVAVRSRQPRGRFELQMTLRKEGERWRISRASLGG
jgi:hypothetical protein